MCAISREERARLARRLRRGELERYRQEVGHLAFCEKEAGVLVGLREVDHRRPALARVAVHVLEEMQRGCAPAVEELHVVGFDVQRVAAVKPADQRVELGETAGRQRVLAAQDLRHLGQMAAPLGVGVAQQRGQHAQRARRRRGPGWKRRAHTAALIGMVRFFSLPNRLVALLPSEQPLPNEKPQPPRTLNAFSAYSRCVDGMTNRSS